jgi:hypothetical protein
VTGRGGTVPAVRAGICVLALALAAPAGGQEPRSAIPWLSESIEIETTPPPARSEAFRGRPDDTITVTPLGAVSRDGVGLLSPEATGLARALWGSLPAAEVATRIAAHPDQGVPAARALFRKLLLAETDPPSGGGGASPALVARIDRLLAIGALAEARALVERAGPETPELFRRWFDIGILLDDAEEPCAALRQNPSLSPTLPARVFCLARSGDWNAAEITLTLGQEVGSIDADQQALLARFLDPALFEEEAEPPVPEPLTALDFLMREAVGLPRPAGPLPLAFLHMDLDEHVPMRVRAEAAERLVLSGALAAPALFATYRSGEPAASGGVWERAQAVQALDAALTAGTGVGPALIAADTALAARGLRVALAEAYGPRLAALGPAEVDPDARPVMTELLLLAGEAAAAARTAGTEPDARVSALLAIAGGGPAPSTADDPRAAAALAGLAASKPADGREAELVATLAEGRQGEAILAALALVQAGATVDPPALRAALLTLRLAGQEPAARAIALQTLLAGDPGR